MQLMVLGLNHRSAPLAIRERFALDRENIRCGLENLSGYPDLHEAVILSTCNRSEIYAAGNNAASSLRQFIFDLTLCERDIEKYLYEFEGEDCIRHLFRVAGGLDSLVLGEGQILSQVKAAYALAKQTAATDTILNTLFNRAIATGKRIRSETRIDANSVSVSYAAVELAKKKLNGLEGRSVLIFGAGKMARLTAQHLLAQRVAKIYVANRHLDKAEALAAEIGGEAVTLKDALQKQTQTDVIVTSTGAPHYVIKAWETRRLMVERQGKELFIIDIAVPRDVEPEVGNIKGVTLYNIDDLEGVIDKHKEQRRAEAKIAEKIVAEEVEALETKFQYLVFQPLMASLAKRSETIRQRELKRIRTKLTQLSDNEWRQIDQMSHMIVRKLLRVPMMKMTMAAGTEQEHFYAEACKALFKLEKNGEASKNGYHRYRYARQ